MPAHRKRRHDGPRRFTANRAAGDHRTNGELTYGELHDLGAMHADDALLDALGSADPDVSDSLSGEQINDLLLSWRHEIDSEPIAELVDTDTAVRVVADARAGRRRRRGLLVPLTSAAAVLIIALGVVGFAARSAQPGDTLWGVTQVLYSDHAQSVQAAHSARANLGQARELLRAGRHAEAQAVLDRMGSLDAVLDEDGRRDLVAERARLRERSRGPVPDTGRPTAPRQATPPPNTPRPAPPSQSPAPQLPAPQDSTPSTGPTSPPTDSTRPPQQQTSRPPTSTIKPPADSAPSDGGPTSGTSGKRPSVPSDGSPSGETPATVDGTQSPTTTR